MLIRRQPQASGHRSNERGAVMKQCVRVVFRAHCFDVSYVSDAQKQRIGNVKNSEKLMHSSSAVDNSASLLLYRARHPTADGGVLYRALLLYQYLFRPTRGQPTRHLESESTACTATAVVHQCLSSEQKRVHASQKQARLHLGERGNTSGNVRLLMMSTFTTPRWFYRGGMRDMLYKLHETHTEASQPPLDSSITCRLVS